MRFDDTTFVADTIKGVRRFEIDKMGRLHPVSIDAFIWKPGWNTATHRGYGDGHKVATKDCVCGFYAFFTKNTLDDQYMQGNKVTGIIEGKGRVSASDLGFRAEQARIIALAVSPKHTGHFWDNWVRLIFPPYSFIGVALFAAWVGLGVMYDDHGWWGVPGLVLGLIFTFFACVGFVTVVSDPEERVWDWSLNWDHPTQYDLLRRNYPDVKVYRSVYQMMRHNTLSTPPEEVAMTPDNPAFWEVNA